MDNPGEAKYGFTYPQLVKGYKELLSRGVRKLGIHAFLASNCLENDYYPTLSRTLFEVAAKLRRDHGITLSVVNLSAASEFFTGRSSSRLTYAMSARRCAGLTMRF